MNLIKTLFEELVSLKGDNAAFCLKRPFSQHPLPPHLCTRFMFAGIKAMSRGISGGKQVPIGRLLQSVILWAVFSIPAIAVEFVYSLKIKRRVIFTCVNEIEAIYGRSLVHVKAEPRSTLLRQLLEEVYLR